MTVEPSTPRPSAPTLRDKRLAQLREFARVWKERSEGVHLRGFTDALAASQLLTEALNEAESWKEAYLGLCAFLDRRAKRETEEYNAACARDLQDELMK